MSEYCIPILKPSEIAFLDKNAILTQSEQIFVFFPNGIKILISVNEKIPDGTAVVAAGYDGELRLGIFREHSSEIIIENFYGQEIFRCRKSSEHKTLRWKFPVTRININCCKKTK